MSKGAAEKVIEVESNEENQHEARGRMRLFGVGKKRPSAIRPKAHYKTKRPRHSTRPLKEYGSYLLSRIVVQYHRP